MLSAARSALKRFPSTALISTLRIIKEHNSRRFETLSRAAGTYWAAARESESIAGGDGGG